MKNLIILILISALFIGCAEEEVNVEHEEVCYETREEYLADMYGLQTEEKIYRETLDNLMWASQDEITGEWFYTEAPPERFAVFSNPTNNPSTHVILEGEGFCINVPEPILNSNNRTCVYDIGENQSTEEVLNNLVRFCGITERFEVINLSESSRSQNPSFLIFIPHHDQYLSVNIFDERFSLRYIRWR